MEKLKAIIIGPWNIFNKAYLPFIFNLEELNIVGIVGRSEEKLIKYKEKYGCDVYTHIEEAIKLKPDCAFVHTSTESHYEIVKKLLESGIHVYVDKPIAEEIDKTKELINLAMDKPLILKVGFNRRYAPMYRKALALFEGLKPEFCIMEKNRHNDIKNSVKFTLYDDFIHVVDTLCYIIKDVESIEVNMSKEEDSLKYIEVVLKSHNSTAIGVMHRNSGKDYERLEIHGHSNSAIVEDMESAKIMDNGKIAIYNFGSWDTTSYRRGFETAVKSFLKDVLEGNNVNDELKCTLKSHEIIEEILKKAL
ncbi:Gfo/Idh/MocA family protein [Thermoanaerobacter wiegelii]|uniref:Oxidoreductase domain protein n=1 Tax=Thermoanaerobacter wiegelii Rt8.B1 TaxID=697303 RepID=G2MRY5_9THEO|nr:Gfo/Idh/MocA family oxidoreductase [Thermoanaerobacter wiegelii]AEM77731.1 oxidoreductase domain protein [Thermoanaerobacter wiegelii Rt8.B1]